MNGLVLRSVKIVCLSALALLALSVHADPLRQSNRGLTQPFEGERGRHMDRLREERLEELRQQRPEMAPRAEGRVSTAMFEAEPLPGSRKMTPEARRQLRHDVREAAREVYRQHP